MADMIYLQLSVRAGAAGKRLPGSKARAALVFLRHMEWRPVIDRQDAESRVMDLAARLAKKANRLE